MTDALKVLGQAAPAAALTTLYTVPAATMTTVSSVVVCNRSAGSLPFRLSVAVAGAADATKQYLYYDEQVAPNDTFVATIGVTLGATDVVRCYGDAGNNLSFNLFGVEVTP